MTSSAGAPIQADASTASSSQPAMPTFSSDSAPAEQKPSSGGFFSWFGGGEQQKPVSLVLKLPAQSQDLSVSVGITSVTLYSLSQ